MRKQNQSETRGRKKRPYLRAISLATMTWRMVLLFPLPRTQGFVFGWGQIARVKSVHYVRSLDPDTVDGNYIIG